MVRAAFLMASCVAAETRDNARLTMDFFKYKNGQLYCEDVPAEKIAAEVGTACYVYSKATLLHHYRQIADAFKPLNATAVVVTKGLAPDNRVVIASAALINQIR